MVNFRFGILTYALLVSLFLSGCNLTGRSASNPPGGSSPNSPVSAPSWTSNGPFVSLLKMSGGEVEKVLGRPTTLKEKANQLYWEYPALGLEIVLIKDEVFFFTQTKGSITGSLRIGDSEDQAQKFAGQLEPSLFEPGAKVGRAHLPELVVEITVEKGRIIRAMVMSPGKDG